MNQSASLNQIFGSSCRLTSSQGHSHIAQSSVFAVTAVLPPQSCSNVPVVLWQLISKVFVMLHGDEVQHSAEENNGGATLQQSVCL